MLLKIIGGLITVLSFSAFGIFKSLQLKENYENAKKITFCIAETKRKIALKNADLPDIVSNAFKDVNTENFTADLKNFINGLGMSDSETAVAKCRIYENYFSEIAAQNKIYYEKYAKLYRVGFTLLGVLLVILLL